jgi:8-oxo-dGTP pyrophosphatase MutT (NUDIX family)
VLLAMFEEDGDTRIFLTKRPDTMPSHQGEIAFPGGKLDEATDASLRDAALREAHEEIGLDPRSVDVVAELDSIVTVMGRFLLTPFVGLLPGRPELHPDYTEVVSVFDASIAELIDDATFREERWDVPSTTGAGPNRNRPVHFFELPGETVWGATAHILANFLEHVTSTR